jgi:hypothetical protein
VAGDETTTGADETRLRVRETDRGRCRLLHPYSVAETLSPSNGAHQGAMSLPAMMEVPTIGKKKARPEPGFSCLPPRFGYC